jgi:hypothetical protein
MGEWEGGKPAGALSEQPGRGFQVSFCRLGKRWFSRFFSVHKYGSMSMAKEAAIDWRIEKSDQLGLTKNKYRLVGNGDSPYYEVKLADETITKVSPADIRYLEDGVFTKHQSGYVVQTLYGKKVHLHLRILNPPEGFQVDHMNRDKLDNRRENIRIVTPSENSRNCKLRADNSSGHTGVCYEKSACRWIAHWRNEDGKRVKRSFSTVLYGEEGALTMALECRVTQAKRSNNSNGFEPIQ